MKVKQMLRGSTHSGRGRLIASDGKMQCLPLLAALALCAGLPVFGQGGAGTPQHHSFSLIAKSVASGGAAKVSGQSSSTGGNNDLDKRSELTASTTQSALHKTSLEISVHNFSPTADECKIEWFFFGQPVRGNQPEFIFDEGDKTLPLKAGGSESFVVESKVAESSVVRSARTVTDKNGDVRSSGKSTESGTKIKGWGVRLMVNGTVVEAKGSDLRYEDIMKNANKLNALKGAHAPAGKRAAGR